MTAELAATLRVVRVRHAGVELPCISPASHLHLDCISVVSRHAGVELENQPTSAGSCRGSHWETRIFRNEPMAP